MISFQRGSANLCRTNGAKQVQHDVDVMTHAAHVLGWQEVETAWHRMALHRLDAKVWAHYLPAGPAGAVPLSWRKDLFTVVSRGSRRTILGIARVTPNRYINHVVLRHTETGTVFVAMNTHMISAAFTRHPGRRALWWVHARLLRWQTVRLARKWGGVTGSGDMNRNKWAPPWARWSYPQHGTHGAEFYDALWSRGTVETGRVTRRTLLSDHDGVVGAVVVH